MGTLEAVGCVCECVCVYVCVCVSQHPERETEGVTLCVFQSTLCGRAQQGMRLGGSPLCRVTGSCLSQSFRGSRDFTVMFQVHVIAIDCIDCSSLLKLTFLMI